MKFLREANVFNKRVLLRVDFNVKFDKQGNILDDFRLQRTVSTINYLKKQHPVRIILVSHLGDPDPKKEKQKEFSLKPLILHLEKLLSQKVYFIDSALGEKKTSQEIGILAKGAICLLENIRFYKEEKENNVNFAKKISTLADLYVNEAFSVSHRQTASLCAITKFLPAFAGLNFEEEIKNLRKISENPVRPLVVIIGGAKIKDKLPLIKKFLVKADYLLIGGALANTILKAWDFEIGNSFFEETMIKEAKTLGSKKAELVLPGDFIVFTKEKRIRKRNLAEIKKTDMILDIGPITSQVFVKIIKKAKTVFWNGPLGKIEEKEFRRATKTVAKVIYNSPSIFAVIGGGETIASLNLFGLLTRTPSSIFLSTGGGAMLEFLAGNRLAGLEALESSSKVKIKSL